MKNEFTMNMQLFGEETIQDTPAMTEKDRMTKAREVDFVTQFEATMAKTLSEMLGVTKKVPVAAGSTLYVYRTVGELEDGAVAEGAVIPLSQYVRQREAVGEMAIRKWRKATTAEAIERCDYNQAVRETDKALLRDVEKSIRRDFITYLTGIVQPAEGDPEDEDYVPAVGVTVTGETLQAVLAKSWAQLQILFEDDGVEPVHFINPLTIADYLADQSITTQTSFGMKYVADFMGMGTVVANSLVPEGQVISTAKDNLVMYYMNMRGETAEAFNLTADELGLIGIKSGCANDAQAQVESLIMTGVRFLVDTAEGVVKGVIGG